MTIQADLTDIKSYAFYGCSKLKNITFTSLTVPNLGSSSFKKINSKAVFYVPRASASKYKKALKAKSFLKKKMKLKKK